MRDEHFDDGLVHSHDWATTDHARTHHPRVADAPRVPTPSSVFHDDHLHAD